ncbi:MAG: lactate utilization protein [Candidatus Rokubacteria bacterium]|nr:lactate utilization protein [Candidatus Rokubacteria bacterium]
MTTRAEFLGRIRAEMRKTGGLFPATIAERPAHPAVVAETVRRELAPRWPETLARFRGEFERVGGTFHRARSADEIPALVAGIARARDARRLIAWHPDAIGRDWGPALAAEGLEAHAMPPGPADSPAERLRLREVCAAADLGLTGVDLAVAETGTLVLRSGAGRPRSTSLLPPYHVAVFDRGALVDSLHQLGILLEAWHEGAPPAGDGAMISFITGPSRTADIELTLTRGVHGPREVHAVFVESEIRG